MLQYHTQIFLNVLISFLLVLTHVHAETCDLDYQSFTSVDEGKKYTTKCPERPEGWNDLGNLFEQKGDFTAAEDAYLRSSKLADTTYPHPWVGLGDVYAKQKRYSEALSAYCTFFSQLKLQGKQDVKYKIPNVAIQQYRTRLFTMMKISDGKIPDGCTPPVKNANFLLTRGLKVKKNNTPIEINLLFRTGTAQILNIFDTQLDELAKAVKKLGDVSVVVEGHTDSQGGNDVNEVACVVSGTWCCGPCEAGTGAASI